MTRLKKLVTGDWHAQLEALRARYAEQDAANGVHDKTGSSPMSGMFSEPAAVSDGPLTFVESMREACEARGVERLYHFTFLKNVRRIFTRGIVPRAMQDALSIEESRVADPLRRDQFLDGSCLSVGFPAYRMFYRRRREHPDEHFVVLELPVDVLWTVHCAFFPTNASEACYVKVDKVRRRSVEAFDEMFADVVSGRERALLNIEPSLPTDPQAEVIAFSTVPSRFIAAVWCQHQKVAATLRDALPEKHHHLVRVNAHLFRPRADYEFWGTGG